MEVGRNELRSPVLLKETGNDEKMGNRAALSRLPNAPHPPDICLLGLRRSERTLPPVMLQINHFCWETAERADLPELGHCACSPARSLRRALEPAN